MGGYLYHVTSYANMPGIVEHGLDPAEKGDLVGSAAYQGHKRGRIFLTEESGIGFWASRVEEFIDNRVDDAHEQEEFPVVLRIREQDVGELEDDELGTRDSGGHEAYMTTEAMDAEDLEIWDGEQWAPAVCYAMFDVDEPFEWDEDDGERWSYFKDPQPYVP